MIFVVQAEVPEAGAPVQNHLQRFAFLNKETLWPPQTEKRSSSHSLLLHGTDAQIQSAQRAVMFLVLQSELANKGAAP